MPGAKRALTYQPRTPPSLCHNIGDAVPLPRPSVAALPLRHTPAAGAGVARLAPLSSRRVSPGRGRLGRTGRAYGEGGRLGGDGRV